MLYVSSTRYILGLCQVSKTWIILSRSIKVPSPLKFNVICFFYKLCDKTTVTIELIVVLFHYTNEKEGRIRVVVVGIESEPFTSPWPIHSSSSPLVIVSIFTPVVQICPWVVLLLIRLCRLLLDNKRGLRVETTLGSSSSTSSRWRNFWPLSSTPLGLVTSLN